MPWFPHAMPWSMPWSTPWSFHAPLAPPMHPWALYGMLGLQHGGFAVPIPDHCDQRWSGSGWSGGGAAVDHFDKRFHDPCRQQPGFAQPFQQSGFAQPFQQSGFAPGQCR